MSVTNAGINGALLVRWNVLGLVTACRIHKVLEYFRASASCIVFAFSLAAVSRGVVMVES